MLYQPKPLVASRPRRSVVPNARDFRASPRGWTRAPRRGIMRVVVCPSPVVRSEAFMPLRDHFHPPWSEQDQWEGFHSAWVNTLVRYLNGSVLPRRFRARPQVHLGPFVEADVATF